MTGGLVSIDIYHEGDHPSGYIGVRLVVGSKSRGDQLIEHYGFREKSKPLSMRSRKEIIAKAKKRERELKAARGGDYRLASKKHVSECKPKLHKNLETNIRGLYFVFQLKRSILANSEIASYPTCFIISEGNGERRAFSTRSFGNLQSKWQEALKHHAKILGNYAILESHSDVPLSKYIFNKHIKRILK